MKKSIYSLVLMDDVIEEIDKLAYRLNTSRSNLINQILAESISFTTPEKRMKDILDEIAKIFDHQQAFQLQSQPSEAMMSLRSALRFKYNPTIRYSVQLYRQTIPAIGELKVVSRTQSRQLVGLLEQFYGTIIWLERAYHEQYFPEREIEYKLENNKFSRTFVLPEGREELSNEQIGTAIAGYIQMFDDAMKGYFQWIGQGQQLAAQQVEKIYREYLQQADLAL